MALGRHDSLFMRGEEGISGWIGMMGSLSLSLSSSELDDCSEGASDCGQRQNESKRH